MAAYLIAAYDVTDPEQFAKYNPGSLPVIMGTMEKHGGKVLSAGGDGTWLQGSRHVMVIIEFPSVEAAEAWESDPEYAPAKAIRVASTGNRFEMIAPSFKMPG
ncbi:MAG: DUF1330 domain-containing protein [Sandaracinaceae bacterium]|nr:DUF1330 domain-containing protein [Sandaracinaceae bacterium]